jgi:hypothetical protein
VIRTCRKLFARRFTRVLVSAVTLLVTAMMVFGFATPDAALARNKCPYGLVNDPYPGRCGRYIDTNGDDICDLSQTISAATTTTTLPVTTTEVVTTTTTDGSSTGKATVAANLTTTTTASGEPPTGDCPLGPCAGCQACVSIAPNFQYDSEASAQMVAAGTLLAVTTNSGSPTNPGSGSGTAVFSDPVVDSGSADTSTDTASGGSSLFTHYLVSPIAFGFLLIYSVSFILYKTKRMKISTHRKIWNVLLLGTFLVTGIFGVILAIQIDYTLPFTIPIDLLFWHVEAGIVMTFISLFHMGWHFKYYRSLLRKTRSAAREARAAERATVRRPVLDNGLLIAQARDERRALRDAQRLQRQAPIGPRPWLEPEAE